MNPPPPEYKRFAILYVDDEEKSLVAFARAFGDTFRVLTAPNAQAGFRILQEQGNDIGLLMTDQRMPGEKGVWLLERARSLHPRILRVLVTAYTDMDAAIAAVNSGAIYKYVSKPWDPERLEIALRQGLDYFMLQRERDQLLREKMSVLRNMMVADRIVSLGLIAAGLSHHIRNSMVAVKTFLELAPVKMAEEKGGVGTLRDPGFWQDYHQNVQSQIEKINGLLADLRTASENPPGQPFADTIQLRPLLEEILAGQQAAFADRHIEIVNDVPADLPPFQADRPKCIRLIELLLKDELAMLPAGSRIHLQAGVEQTMMVLRLTDNGPALPKEVLRVVLDPFTGGTPAEYGINLMACFFIAHHHGGAIEVSSQPGGGNAFILRLPLHPETAGPSPECKLLKETLLDEQLWQRLATG